MEIKEWTSNIQRHNRLIHRRWYCDIRIPSSEARTTLSSTPNARIVGHRGRGFSRSLPFWSILSRLVLSSPYSPRGYNSVLELRHTFKCWTARLICCRKAFPFLLALSFCFGNIAGRLGVKVSVFATAGWWVTHLAWVWSSFFFTLHCIVLCSELTKEWCIIHNASEIQALGRGIRGVLCATCTSSFPQH